MGADRIEKPQLQTWMVKGLLAYLDGASLGDTDAAFQLRTLLVEWAKFSAYFVTVEPLVNALEREREDGQTMTREALEKLVRELREG